MKRQKKSVVWLLILAFVTSFLPSISVKASDDMQIVSTTNITAAQAKTWAKDKGATNTFISLADLYWKYAASHGNVNPAIAYVQAAKETGYGKFGGVLNESYHNPCGLKTTQGGSDTDVNAHKKFNNWDEGVQAHIDHLALYAGASGYPRSNTYDPRHFPSIKGNAKTVVALGGKWAPSPTYGSEILLMYRQLEVWERNKKMYGNIDTPKEGSTLSSNTINVKGWALNPSGISKVSVYIDDVFKGNATIGQSRPDVAGVYSYYPEAANSGYSMQIDVRGLSEGTKTLRVEQYGRDGSKNVTTTKFNISKLNSIQNIDSPTNNSTISSKSLTVRGWSLSKDDIKSINFYIDNKFKGSTIPNVSRADVAKVYSTYPNAENSGFNKTLDISDIGDGIRTLRVEQVTSKGEKYNTELKINVANLVSRQDINSPKNNAIFTGNNLEVSGWALSGENIKSINFYIDNTLMGSTVPNIKRTDVEKVYPQYPNALNSGFKKTLDISRLSEGLKTLKVEQVTSSGKKYSKEVKVSIVRINPITNIDGPKNDTTITNKLIDVYGWALNRSGVKAINIYVDSTLVKTTTTGVSRLDVNKVYPQYFDEKSGYRTTIDLTGIPNGKRTIKVEQVGLDGTRQTKSVNVNLNVQKLKSIGNIDRPVANSTVSDNKVRVSGWTLSDSGVKEVKVYVDGKEKGSTKVGVSREDVAKVYPQYIYANKCGFDLNVDISDITSGTKNIEVKSISNDGSIHSMYSKINISRLSSKQDINSPRDNSVIAGDSLEVTGWSISGNSIKSINFYIDNTLMGSTVPNVSRPDVANVYPQYPNVATSGFKKTLDVSKLTAGTKTLKVEQVTTSGEKYSSTVSINIKKLNPILNIDGPKYDTTITKRSMDVYGWALNKSGVKAINIYIDSTLVKTTTTGVSRLDVNKVYPQYNDEKSGYRTTIDLRGISNGKKTLKVEQIGVDGSKVSKTTTINLNVPKLSSIGNIDTPVANSNITSTKVKVSGWAVSDSGVKEIKVYVDGKEKGSTTVGISREDVGKVYPEHKNSNKSGYSVNIDINNIAPGTRTFEVKEISYDGSINVTSIKANIVKKSPIMVIDTPTSNYLEKGDTIDVVGWALNPSGVNNINVYVDGNKRTTVKPSISRSDVINVYPGYQTSDVCGYKASVSLAGLVVGAHSILVEAVGVDGTISTVSQNIYYKQNTSKLIVLDPGHNFGGDDGAYATHNGVRYSERDINMDIAMKTKVSLESIGYRVVLTRLPADREYLGVTDSLTKRVNLANSLKADLFISIHQNSFTSESANGTEVYYTTKTNDSNFPASSNRDYKLSTSKSLATKVTNSISSLGFTNRGAKDGNLFVIRNTTMPAILVECGFISNLKDVKNLTNSTMQERIASSIASSVKGNI